MEVEYVVTHHISNAKGRMKFRVSMRLFKKKIWEAILDVHAGRDVATAPQTPQLGGGPGQLWGPKLV